MHVAIQPTCRIPKGSRIVRLIAMDPAEEMIETERYCWAFETWASLPRETKLDTEEAVVARVCAHLRAPYPGVHPIETLCGVFATLIELGTATSVAGKGIMRNRSRRPICVTSMQSPWADRLRARPTARRTRSR